MHPSANIVASDLLQKSKDQIKAGRLDEAEVILRKLAKKPSNKSAALQCLGLIELKRERFQKAKAIFNRALGVQPKTPEVHFYLSIALKRLGDHKRAMAHLQQAILLRPDFAEAYVLFSQEVRFRPGHPMIKVIEDLLAKDGLSQVDRCLFHFAAGKAYDDIGDYDRAMAHYHQGNAAKDAKYDLDALSQDLKRITMSFTPGRFAALAGTGLAEERMVFVVGMPRSGTTLVEQIIASHPRAHGAGELAFIASAVVSLVVLIVNESAKSPEGGEKSSLQGPATRYLRDVMAHTANQGMPANTERIVDKMPANYKHLGWIKLMFPKAKIIHCRRDPRDTCLSCYFQDFKIGNDFAFDLSHLGFHYRQYQALMRHWRDVLVPQDQAAGVDGQLLAGPPAALPGLGRALAPLREAPGTAARSLGREGVAGGHCRIGMVGGSGASPIYCLEYTSYRCSVNNG
jgi:tetratricopeptide (TPR) repeat protein